MKRPTCPALWGAPLVVLAAVAMPHADPSAGAPTKAAAPPAISIPPKSIPITGTVQNPDGRPAAGATVTLAVVDYKAHALVSTQTVVTPPGGAYAFSLPLGTPGAHVAPVLWATSADAIGVVTGGWPGPLEITRQPETRVRVRLTGQDGTPLAGVGLEPSLFLHDHSGASWDGAADPRWTVRTGADGWATLTGLPQGMTMGLNVLDERYTEPDSRSQVTLAAARETPDTVIQIQAGSVLTGRVICGPTGLPAAGVSVAVSQDGAAYFRGDAETDADGRYKLTRMPPGEYSLALGYRKPGAEQWATPLHTVTVPPGAAAVGPDIVLVKGGLLTGLVTDKNTSRPLPGIRLVVNGPAHPSDSESADFAVTGPDGRYSLRVPPGVQTVYADVRGTDDPVRQQSVTVADGQTATVDFRVTAPAAPVAVQGVVVGPDGEPVAGAEVMALTPGEDETTRRADAQGRFTFDQPGLSPKARLYARIGELGTGSAVIPAASLSLRLAAGALCTFRGQVLGQDGRPVPGAGLEGRQALFPHRVRRVRQGDEPPEGLRCGRQAHGAQHPLRQRRSARREEHAEDGPQEFRRERLGEVRGHEDRRPKLSARQAARREACHRPLERAPGELRAPPVGPRALIKTVPDLAAQADVPEKECIGCRHRIDL